MQHLASSMPLASTPTDQCVRLVLEAEIFQDPDDGPDSLIYSTDTVACEPVSAARMLDMVAEARTKLDRIERITREFEARDTLAAMLDEAGLALEEWPTDSLDERIRHQLRAVYFNDEGRPTVVVPQGQDLIERVNAVSTLIGDLQAQAAA